LAIALMVSALGHISGGHFNPAITFGFVVTKRIDVKLAGVYWVVQFGGALAAALLVKWLVPGDALAKGVPAVHGVSSFEAAVLEAVMTFFLVWVGWAAGVGGRGGFKGSAGLRIGVSSTMAIS